MSRALKVTKKSWSTYAKGMLAIVEAYAYGVLTFYAEKFIEKLINVASSIFWAMHSHTRTTKMGG